jgi:hypothetical protein
MRRHPLAAIAAALVLALAMPSTVGARAEVVGSSGAGCCIDVGVRLTVNLEAGAIRGAVVALPGFELFSVTLGVPDAVRWGIPLVSIVAGVTTARTSRLVTESGLF